MKFPKLPFCLLLLLAPLLTQQAQARTIAAPSRISSVTVFPDRAQVTRRATVSLDPGSNLVTVDSLPQLMDEDSLRVEGKGSGRARIAGVTIKKLFLEKVQEKRVRQLEEEIALLKRKVDGIEAKGKGLAAQRAFVNSIRVGWGERISREIAVGKPTAAELGEAMRFVGEGIGKIEEQLNEAEAAKKPLVDRIEALKRELEQNRAEGMKEVRSVQVAIEAEKKMEFALELSYLVAQASWEPGYDLRLAPGGKEAELVYRARVRQKSGEDWPGVKLTLSTARPEAGGAPPELSPWHVSLYEPPRPLPYAPQYGAGRMETMAAKPAAPAPAEDQMEKALPMPVQISEGESSVQFGVPTPVEIPADGTQSDSVIATERLPVTVAYLTVPKLSARVYLKSEVTNNGVYPLLPGEVSVFNDALFVGKTRLKTVSSGEKFDLFFGSDDQVKVKREATKVRKKGGLLGSNRVSYRTTVQLQNFKKRPVTVSMLDQLPIPGNAEIKVELEDASPKPDQTKEDGTLLWKVDLPAGAAKKITYDIVIEYPKGRELVGVE